MEKENPTTSDELRKILCPKCARKMAHGFIAGHWFNLRWVKRNNTKTIFAGTKLRKKFDSIWSAPNIEAVRCPDCKIGVFRYDY